MASVGRDDAPVDDEEIRYRHRLIQQAAWIAAQVENETGKIGSDVAHGQLELLAQGARGALIEPAYFHDRGIAEARIPDRLRNDMGTDHGHGMQFNLVLAGDGQIHLATQRTAQAAHHFPLGQAHRRFAVDLDD